MRIAEEKQIIVNCVIDFTKGNFIEPLDICSIFGNLLDNAIEYYDRFKDCKNKYIDIKINTVNEFLVIKITNCLVSKIEMKNGKICTTKEKKNMHGIGLLSVKESVEKYDGYFNVNISESEYVATILFPLM